MTAIRPQDLTKYVGLLYIRPFGSSAAFTRLGSVRGLIFTLDPSANAVEVNADDTGTVFSGNRKLLQIDAELLEAANTGVLQTLLGGVNRVDTPGTPTAVTGEALGTGWTIGQPIKLANKNGDNTIVSSIVIDADGTPLVAGTDYNTYVGNGNNGDLGFTYIVPITAQAGVLDADYSYTPNATETVEFDSSFQENTLLEVRIIADEGGSSTRQRITTLAPARFEAAYNMNYLDVVEAGDLTGATLTFIGEKGSKATYQNEIV